MQVKEVMSYPVRSVSPDTKIMEVASMMCLHRLHGIPIVDDEGKIIGIIAEKDVLHSLFPTLESLMEEGFASVDLDREMAKYKDILAKPVTELMTPKPITVNPEMHVLRAATIMVRHKFRRLPVTENDKLVGMLSIGDVHKAIFHANMTDRLRAQEAAEA